VVELCSSTADAMVLCRSLICGVLRALKIRVAA
jgi:hypothetical protein